MRSRKRALGTAALLLTGSVTAMQGCAQQPTEDPILTLERAERLATFCLQVREEMADGTTIPLAEPVPVADDFCGSVPTATLESSGRGEAYPYHLYAAVTQTLRGELGVVDLTAYKAVDTDRSTPGVNFVSVGEAPTDVATTPDGKLIFVASAASSKPALYKVRSIDTLGNSRNPDAPVPTSASLFGCALPQAPSSLAVVPNGRTDSESPFNLVVVLPGDRNTPARVALLDATALDAPGAFDACPLTDVVDATLPPPPPDSEPRAWSDGVTYVEGGALLADRYPLAPSCAAPGPDEPLPPVEPAPLLPERPVRLGRSTLDGTTLYVADENNPVIHVFDVGVTPPVELAPLEVVSSADPSGQGTVRELSVSPATRDYRRFLYAIENTQGSLLVYDVTERDSSYRKPLVRPHAELQPFQPADRVAFGSQVNAVTFVKADLPVRTGSAEQPSYASGLLCNPNARGGDLGALYTDNLLVESTPLGPTRLRGVFAMAALADGRIAVLDVDDWDAPCRRPVSLGDDPRFSALAEPLQPVDGDAYGGPIAVSERVSREAFFPVSAPHRLRSAFMLRNEPGDQGGNRIPNVPGGFTLSQGNTPLDIAGPLAPTNPLILPTRTAFQDPNVTPENPASITSPGVRFAYEQPDVHVEQDWTVTYEGLLPSVDGIRGVVTSTDGFQSLVVSNEEARFCRRGLEDVALGQERVRAFEEDLLAAGEQPVPGTDDAPALIDRVGDYVQITDELLAADDPYWQLEGNDCWGEVDRVGDASASDSRTRGAIRHDVCEQTFGTPAEARSSRDLPILEAYDGKLVLGRYSAPRNSDNEVVSRRVLSANASNVGLLSAAKCCFHNQVTVRARAGASWLAQGSASGYLHHVLADEGGRCVQSCESRESLLNARSFGLPRSLAGDASRIPDRNSRLAMRNPLFSFVMFNGTSRPNRDFVWRFATRGQFAALSLDLASRATTVNIRSLRFLPALAQVAVLDGSSQGMNLIDLRSVKFVANPLY